VWLISCFIQLKYGCSSSEDHQFIRGIPIYAISHVLEKIISGTQGPFQLINGVKRPMPFIRLLEVELYPTLLSKARSYGLSDNWVQVMGSIFLLINQSQSVGSGNIVILSPSPILNTAPEILILEIYSFILILLYLSVGENLK
jgi:hypothetical protein